MHVYGNLGGAAGDKGADRASERLGLFADGPETKGENRGSGYARVINGDLFMETRYSGRRGGGLNAFAKSGNPVALQGRPFGSVNHDRSLMSRYFFFLSRTVTTRAIIDENCALVLGLSGLTTFTIPEIEGITHYWILIVRSFSLCKSLCFSS